MQALKDEGVIAHLGVAGGPIDLLRRYISTGAFAVVLTHNRYSLIDQSAEPLFEEAAELGVAVLNITAVVGASLAAKAIGGYELQCVIVLACSVLAWSMGSELLIDVWQPHALLLPFLALIVLALGLDVPLSGVLVAVVPLLAICVTFLVRRLRPLFRSMQVRLDTVNRVLREQISGNRVIRAFVRDEYEKDRFAGANRELTEVALGTGRILALMFPMVMTVVNLSSIAVHPDCRGQGLGRALTAALTRRLLDEGCDLVTLGMYADNDAARAVYDALGWRAEHRFTSGPLQVRSRW